MNAAAFTGLSWLPAIAFGGGLVANSSVGLTPLNELGTGTYLGAQGGLYPGGENLMPAAHRDDGMQLAAQIQRLDAAGNPSPTGQIGVLTLGMSNANQVFSKLGELMNGLWAPGVVFVNGAQGSMDAALWANSDHVAWTNAQNSITAAGLTAAQIQVVLNFHAVAHIQTPAQAWPVTPGDLQTFQESIAAHILSKFPNTKLTFWGTREYGGYATSLNNPEPYAYQSAFAVKWMLEKQIHGLGLNHHPARGPVAAPWMAWGPYLWADGLKPRLDGLLWEPRDFQSDGVHPNSRGRVKEAGPWARLLRTDPITASKLVPAGNLTPLCSMTFPQDNVAVTVEGPVSVEAFAQDDDGAISRVDFYQGTTFLGSDTEAPYAVLWQPPAPGDYPLHAVAVDDAGNTRTSLVITGKLRAATTGVTLANDSFESGDLLGGGGWAMSNWLSGAPMTVLNTSASDGVWSVQVGAGGFIARSVSLTSPASARLEFSWRAALPAGGSFLVEINDGSWKTVFSRTGVNQATWSQESLPLAAYAPSSNMGVRFRVLGSGAVAGVDQVQVATSSTPASVMSVSPRLQLIGGSQILLLWPATSGKTYRIEFSPNLTSWTPAHHTTADETSTISWMNARQGSTGFYRIETLAP